MQAWKKLEEFCADFLSDLGWIRKKKKSYGDKIWDLAGQGFKGECKHWKAHKIHTIKNETDAKYKDDVLIFTKVKRTHYLPSNVFVTISLKLLKEFLINYRTMLKLDKSNKDVNLIDNMLRRLLDDLDYKVGIINVSASDMKKVIRKIREVK